MYVYLCGIVAITLVNSKRVIVRSVLAHMSILVYTLTDRLKVLKINSLGILVSSLGPTGNSKEFTSKISVKCR